MKPMLITKPGCRNLGALLEKGRRARGWSLDTLVDFIQNTTGETLSKAALSTLERGTVEPKFNTLAIIAAAGYVVNPEGIPYSLQDLWLIACEKLALDNQGDELALHSPSDFVGTRISRVGERCNEFSKFQSTNTERKIS
jgi:transcriptional regulator with XRE-family HTH domain